jgi:broad specificity phosphatase PhoE
VKLTLIRHGTTNWNASRRFQGQTDVPLSEEGRAQAAAIAAALRSERFDRIYASDLARALETARILAASRNMEVVADRRLREFDFGRWEGLTWEQIVAIDPRLGGQPPTRPKLYDPDGGESFAQVCARVRAFFDDLAQQPFDSVAIVTHAGPLHAALTVLDLAEHRKSGRRFSAGFAPGGITRMTMDREGTRVIDLNDLQHLSP